jgi:tetratricopeptide (TPR) repeat protein
MSPEPMKPEFKDPQMVTYIDVAKIVAEKLIKYAIERASKHDVQELSTQITSIEHGTHNLQLRAENLSAAPLRSAISFLRIGEPEKARDALIHAASNDPRGAVARILLGFLLAKEGHISEAEKRLDEARLINPLVFPQFDIDIPLSVPVPEKQIPSNWRVKLTQDRSYSGALPDQGWLDLFAGPRDQSALLRIGCCAGNIVMTWHVKCGHYYHDNRGDILICSIEGSTGRCLWSRKSKGEELLLVTPMFVVLKPNDSAGTYSFLAASTGNPLIDMSQDYFQTIFCVGWSGIAACTEYRRSHKSFLTPIQMSNTWDEVLHEQRAKLNWFQRLFHLGIAKNISEEVIDVMGSGVGRYCARNDWEGKFEISGGHLGPNKITRELKCEASVERLT